MPDQTPRYQLERLAREVIDSRTWNAPALVAVALVDAVLATGWRPPARVITDPAELDALPYMCVVLAYGVAHQSVPSELVDLPLWLKPTGERAYTSAELLAACRGAGVTVLHTPENGDNR